MRLACQWVNDGSTKHSISKSCSLGVTYSTNMFFPAYMELQPWKYITLVMFSPAAYIQATHTKESTERMLLVAYMHKTSSPLVKAYAIAASYPYLANSPAILDAVIQRLERHVRITG